ncbi:MAG: ferritin-like domain-containing protein [Candidatus Aminicenantes bacterium]|nr:ferritin-like domain-containing protein [Candidatus Aminicenantes bacterium]
MLNKDIRDEHAAIIRYLVHGYLEGEDSPIGASLLSRSREEMWHMHWLGMIIGRLEGEPDMTPAPYPFDPANRKSIFKSYVDYENKLIPHYNQEANKVDDPHIKRVLQREAWESAIHASKFQRISDKLSPEQAAGLPGETNKLPEEFLETLQEIVEKKYIEILQHIRNAWVFQSEGSQGWQIMDFSMTKMKQLAHIAEEVAENGIKPRLKPGKIDISTAIGSALKRALEDVRESRKRHLELQKSEEGQRHAGLIINLDLSVRQEKFEIEEIEDWLKKQ